MHGIVNFPGLTSGAFARMQASPVRLRRNPIHPRTHVRGFAKVVLNGLQMLGDMDPNRNASPAPSDTPVTSSPAFAFVWNAKRPLRQIGNKHTVSLLVHREVETKKGPNKNSPRSPHS